MNQAGRHLIFRTSHERVFCKQYSGSCQEGEVSFSFLWIWALLLMRRALKNWNSTKAKQDAILVFLYATGICFGFPDGEIQLHNTFFHYQINFNKTSKTICFLYCCVKIKKNLVLFTYIIFHYCILFSFRNGYSEQCHWKSNGFL